MILDPVIMLSQNVPSNPNETWVRMGSVSLERLAGVYLIERNHCDLMGMRFASMQLPDFPARIRKREAASLSYLQGITQNFSPSPRDRERVCS